MKRALRYGRGSVVVNLPSEGCRAVIEPPLPPAIKDVEDVVARCVEEPVNSAALSKRLVGCRRIVVVIPDATRGEGIRVYLEALLRFIERAGLTPDAVTVLSATGAHSVHSDTQRQALVGPEVAAKWRVVDHDPDRGNVALGQLDADTPILVDERALEADFLILAGQISYHYCAGYGGGRKLIAPGLCARVTVQALHRRTLANIDAAGNWRSRTGSLHGNPFHEALLAVAQRVGPHFALNVTVGWQGQVLGVVAGDPLQSHRVACLQYDQTFRVPISERAPLVVASCGGWPFDINLYQAHKALDNAFRAVRPGGTIVLLAQCVDGWGPESFVRWLAIDSLGEHRERLQDQFEVAGHTTYALKWKATQCRVIIVSDVLAKRLREGEGPAWLLEGADTLPFRIEIVGQIDEALDRADAKSGLPFYVMPVASVGLPEVVSG